MIRKRARVFLLALGLCLLGAGVAPARGRTIRVMRDGTGDYTTIQPAVDAASPGDTVLIGPGRYTEHAAFSPAAYDTINKKWPIQTYIGVRTDSLTIRGTVRDQVIIGPALRNLAVDEIGIMNRTTHAMLNIHDLQVDNVFEGCCLYGKIVVDNCAFNGNAEGVVYRSPEGILLTRCEFRFNNTGFGTYGGAINPVVYDCYFANNLYGIDLVWTLDGSVANCVFLQDYVGVQLEQASTGVIRDCHIDSRNACISIRSNSSAEIVNNICTGHEWFCAYLHGQVTATRNVFRGGDSFTVGVCTAPVRVNGNDILRGAGLSAQVGCAVGVPLQTFDLKYNYWGTSSADSIRAWTYDHTDDPAVYGTVEFEPYSPTALPTEKKSLGGVKGLYR